MSYIAVEWILVIRYLLSHHKATYGRLSGTTYTKDYIQLSRDAAFLTDLGELFGRSGAENVVPLTYKWPGGTAPGSLIFRSADRPHLSWETWRGAPSPWRMRVAPVEGTVETIPGDPAHENPALADAEFDLLAERGAGQPILVAVKLAGEVRTLHLRAYLDGPSGEFGWADATMLPQQVQDLVRRTSRQSALAWSRFGGEGASVLYFDPSLNHSAWGGSSGEESPQLMEESSAPLTSSVAEDSAIAAESLDASEQLVDEFRKKIEEQDYSVEDVYGSLKSRGSAQRAFSERVKRNYGGKCAVTGISTRKFLVAAHIVPWSVDKRIRLDPSNGICLSVLIDRAFEEGYIVITDDLRVVVRQERLADDERLREALIKYDGRTLRVPTQAPPRIDYLRRRRGEAPTPAPS